MPLKKTAFSATLFALDATTAIAQQVKNLPKGLYIQNRKKAYVK